MHLFACPYNVSLLATNQKSVIEIRSTALLLCLLIHIITTLAHNRYCTRFDIKLYFFQIVKEQKQPIDL